MTKYLWVFGMVSIRLTSEKYMKRLRIFYHEIINLWRKEQKNLVVN